MRNGIKKLFRIGLLGIFSCLFLSGNVFGISVINECYKNNPNSNTASNQRPCLDFQPGEQLTIGEYTSYITGNFNFMSNNPLIFSSSLHNEGSSTYDSYSYTFYQNDGYITTLNTIYKDTDTLLGTYIYTGAMYCLVSDTTNTYNFGVCSAGNYANSKMYSGTVEEAIAYITGHTITGYRLLFDFRETTQGQINDQRNRADMGICAMLENNTAVCIKALGSFNSRASNCNNSSCIYSGVNRTQNINMGTGDITYQDLLTTYKLSSSPFTIEQQEQDTPIIYTGTITNQHAIYAYEQLGLTPQQCYGGYPIDTIYNTGTILYQGYQAGTGASILDLYNLYSGNYNGYQSTYMTEEQTKITQFLSEIYQGYENNGLSFFIGKPESIITIIQQYNNANQKATEKGRGYSIFQLYTYCDLLINHNNNEEYTGNTATPDMRRNGIDTENQEIVLPVTGSVFDELQQDGEFKRNKAQDVRDTINSVYTKLTKIFKLRGGIQGIIPDYITRILLLIILFAIFKK